MPFPRGPRGVCHSLEVLGAAPKPRDPRGFPQKPRGFSQNLEPLPPPWDAPISRDHPWLHASWSLHQSQKLRDVYIFILAAIGAHPQESPTASSHSSAAGDLDNLYQDVTETEGEEEDEDPATDQSDADIESAADSDDDNSDVENPSSQKG